MSITMLSNTIGGDLVSITMLSNALIPGVSLEFNLSRVKWVFFCIPGVDVCQVANRSGLDHLSMLSSPQEWKCMCP